MRQLQSLVTAFLATAALVASSHAQAATDSTPFHRSQWAAQFVAGTQFFSAGVLHFRSPRSAWLLDGSVGYSHNTLNSTDVTGATSSITYWTAGGTLRFGQRNFKPLGPSTQFFNTLGVVVRGGTSEQTGPSSNWFWGAGLFGELGANYMITPHLGLGAAAGVQVLYNRQATTITSGGLRTDNSQQIVSVSGALLSLMLGVYF